MRGENRQINHNNRAKTRKNAPALGDLVYGSHVPLLEKTSHEKNPFSNTFPQNLTTSRVRTTNTQHESPLTGTSKSSASDMMGVLVVKIGKVQLDVLWQSPARRRETESGRRRSAHAPGLPRRHSLRFELFFITFPRSLMLSWLPAVVGINIT